MTMPGRQQYRSTDEPNLSRHETNMPHKIKAISVPIPLVPHAAILARLNVHNPRPADPG
jgi:hypothetical protein